MSLDFSYLKGKILSDIALNKESDDEIVFTLDDGIKFKLYHEQDCCENVIVDDIVGDLKDLINDPILVAEERTAEDSSNYDIDESNTWTFYELATIKGNVTIKWHGSSNGYYSESVSFGFDSPVTEQIRNINTKADKSFLTLKYSEYFKEEDR